MSFEDKLQCNAACKGIGDSINTCDGAGDGIYCRPPGNTPSGGEKLVSVPDWTDVEHKDKKTGLL